MIRPSLAGFDRPLTVARGLPLSTSAPAAEFLSQRTIDLDIIGSQPSLTLPVQLNVWYA